MQKKYEPNRDLDHHSHTHKTFLPKSHWPLCKTHTHRHTDTHSNTCTLAHIEPSAQR